MGILILLFILCNVYDKKFTVIMVIILYSWWRHEMETFSTLLAICAGNYSPHKGQ